MVFHLLFVIPAVIHGVAIVVHHLVKAIEQIYQWFQRYGYHQIASYCKGLKRYVDIYVKDGYFTSNERIWFKHYLGKLQEAAWKDKLRNNFQTELLQKANEIEGI